MQSLPQALAPLAQFNQWVLWLGVPDPKRPGKTNKFPVNPTTGDVVDADAVDVAADCSSARASATASSTLCWISSSDAPCPVQATRRASKGSKTYALRVGL